MRHDRPDRTAISRGWTAVAVAMIVIATLTPQIGSPGLRQDFFAPLILTARGVWRDVLQNILLYMPLGVAMALRRVSWLRALLIAASLSASTEIAQFAVPGRDPFAADIATNVCGALVGLLLALTPLGRIARAGLLALERSLALARTPSHDLAATLSVFWALGVAAVLMSTCWLLSPAIPPPFYYLVTGPFMDTVPGPWRIGGDGSQSGAFTGLIDEVRVYAGARSADAIERDMHEAVASSPSSPDVVTADGFDAAESQLASGQRSIQGDGVSGATWSAAGRFGGALMFDGRGTGLEVPGASGNNLSRSMTIEAWVNPAGYQRGSATIVTHAGDTSFLRASAPNGLLLPAGGGRFGENPRELRLRRSIPANSWTHLATTYDGRIVQMFVNGRPAARLPLWSTHHPESMQLDEVPLAFGAVPSPERIRSILSNDFTLNLALRCGALDEEPAPAFRIVGVQSRDVLTIEAAGSELRVRTSTWGTGLGFAPVPYRIPQALSNCAPGQIARLKLRGPLQNPRLELGARTPTGIRAGIGSAWAFLLDSRLFTSRAMTAVSVCYLAVLTLPFGYWARRTWSTLAGAGLMVAVVFLAPRAWGIPAIDALQTSGLVLGCLAGVVAWRWTADRPTGDRRSLRA